MKHRKLLFLLTISMLFFLPGCDIIVGIFEAGFWTAIILIILICLAVFYGYSKFKSRN